MPKRIWVVEPDCTALNLLHRNTAVSTLGIEVTEVGDDYLCARMPVDQRTMQPFGLMHGGAAVLLLETVASAAANHCVDRQTHICVGVEINCNHIRSARSGQVTGRAQALYIGRTSMVWQLESRDDSGRLVTVGRLTSSIVALAG